MSAIGLGRKRPPDESKDRQYLLPRLELRPLSGWRFWASKGVLDQGATSQCVGYSGFKYLTSGPVYNKYPKHEPQDLYAECLKVDEWPGEDWDGGTSVRALFKVFKRLGYVSGYRWAFDAETIVGHLLSTGPVVMGTNWYRDMFMPHNKTGYISVSGEQDGGHAWLIVGVDRYKNNPDGSTGAIRMVNSWGIGWGQDGRAWMTIKDLDRLVKEEGEACVASEIKISALSTVPSAFA